MSKLVLDSIKTENEAHHSTALHIAKSVVGMISVGVSKAGQVQGMLFLDRKQAVAIRDYLDSLIKLGKVADNPVPSDSEVCLKDVTNKLTHEVSQLNQRFDMEDVAEDLQTDLIQDLYRHYQNIMRSQLDIENRVKKLEDKDRI